MLRQSGKLSHGYILISPNTEWATETLDIIDITPAAGKNWKNTTPTPMHRVFLSIFYEFNECAYSYNGPYGFLTNQVGVASKLNT